MNAIPPYQLWLGHAGDGRDLRQIYAAGIRALVELAAEEAPAPTPRDLIVCRFPLVDGSGNDPAVLGLALRTVAGLLERNIPTLLCCGAGMSRAPAFAAGALALVTGQHPEDCLQQLVAHRPADVMPALWAEIVITVTALTTR
jgi:protein-tyrosine phosphatase